MKRTRLNPVFIYLLITFIAGLSNKLTFTTSAIYRVEVVGLTALQLVLVGTTLEITAFLFEIPTGIVADVYSRRLSTIIGIFLVGIGFIIEGLLPSFWVVLLSQILWGLGWTFISGARTAWITDEIGVENITPIFLRGGQIGMLGSLAAIPLVLWLANVSLAIPYFVGGGVRILLVIFLIFTMPETGFKPRPQEDRESWSAMLNTAREGLAAIRQQPVLLWFALIALFVGLYSEGWDRLSDAHLLKNHTFPDLFGIQLNAIEWFSILTFIGVLLGLLANEFAKHAWSMAQTCTLARVLQGMYTFMVLAVVGFALAGQVWLAIGFSLLFNTLRGVTFPLQDAFINQYIKSDVRATVLSMTNQVDALGQMAGGPPIGLVGQLVSIPAAILTAAGILSPVVPLFELLIRRDKGKSG